MTDLTELNAAVRHLADTFYRVDREWDAVRADDESGEAIDRALKAKYPFRESIGDISGEVYRWSEDIERIAKNPPGLLADVAGLLRADVAKVSEGLRKEQPNVEDADAYHTWQTGGLGGEVGDFGAAMGLGVGRGLADLLEAVAAGDTDAAQQSAQWVAREYKRGRPGK